MIGKYLLSSHLSHCVCVFDNCLFCATVQLVLLLSALPSSSSSSSWCDQTEISILEDSEHFLNFKQSTSDAIKKGTHQITSFGTAVQESVSHANWRQGKEKKMFTFFQCKAKCF